MSGIDEFVGITGALTTQADFFLKSANGDLAQALELFYAEHGGDDARSASSADAGGTGERVGSAGVGEIGRPSSGSSVNGGGGGGRASKSSSSRRTGLATFSSLRDAEEEDDDDDEKPAEFYTGGEKSGLGVIDPNKARRQQGTGGAGTSAGGSAGPQDLLEQILRKAAAGGSNGPGEEDEDSMAGGSGGRSAFRGSGYTLGGDETESRKVEDPNEPLRRLLAQRPQEVKRVLKLWRNGFSVDDGPLYRFDDPANKAYLEQINNGRAPLEVLNVEYGQPVTVHVEKRSDEDYTPPPKTHKPFEGKGHRLGAEIPPRPEPVNPPTSAAEPTSAGSKTKTPQADVDESKPTTTVQVRMASGGRLALRLNTTHTIADLYALVSTADNESGSTRDFVLLTPFPRKEFAKDDTTTVETAGLLKGVVQQKYL